MKNSGFFQTLTGSFYNPETLDHFQKLGSKLKFGFFAEKKSYRNARQKTTGQLQKLGSKC
jgi:hypothetical protein